MNPNIGIILPQHYLNPKFLGIEHLKIISTIPLNKISSVIIDVKDIFGLLYLNIDIDNRSNWKFNKPYISYFNEITKICDEYTIKKVFGIPCLYDNSIYDKSMLVKNEYGKILPGRICLNNAEYKEKLIELINKIYKRYSNDTFFLPFLRYLPFNKFGFNCVCDNCKRKYFNDFSRELNTDLIRNDINEFRNWVLWRCEQISDFIIDMRKNFSINAKYAIEIDIEPIKYLNEGILINDGHNYKILSKCVDEFIIHYYDSSNIPSEHLICNDTAFNISIFNIADIMNEGKPVSLFFWNINSYDDFKKKYLLARKINPDFAYFLLFSNQIKYFNNLAIEGLF